MSTAKKESPLCNQCGRRLILIGKTESKDSFSKIVIKTYRCPDEECQKAIDKRTKARLKLQKEQDRARKIRTKAKLKVKKTKKLKIKQKKHK